MEIQERANKYASEKTNEVMIQAIAQAYRDGYQDMSILDYQVAFCGRLIMKESMGMRQ